MPVGQLLLIARDTGAPSRSSLVIAHSA